MQLLLSAPAIIKVLASLALILLVSRLTRSVSLAILAGSVVLAFWAGHNALGFLRISWERLSGLDNILLLVVILMVIWLSDQMSQTGVLNSLVESFQSGVSNRASLALLPALVGLLPMPGGALFSAPLVDQCDKDGNLDSLLKVRINYWFRHIWEYWWPLYAGVLLAVDLAGIQLWHLIAAGVPVTLISAFGGWLFLLRKVPRKERDGRTRFDVSSLVPVMLVIVVYAALAILVPAVREVSTFLPIAVGIIVAIIYLQLQRPLPWKVWAKILFSRKTAGLVVLVAIIRIYGAFLEAPLPDGQYIVEQMRVELEQSGVPILPLVMIIPFIAGLTTGIALGMVGASFPIIIQLAGTDPTTAALVSTAILGYAAGHVGQLVSPVHVCLLVTNKYFSTSILQSLRGLWGPCLFVLAGGFIMSRIVLLL